MPIFEYKCGDCEKVFEIVHLPGKDSELKCAACGSTNLKKLISAPFLPSSVGKPANDELKSCCGAADPQECPGPGSCCSQ
ncbi:MAG TPA: zinc ribbon domain-containing protein [Pelotomaculum sp.]|nr:zinc ribbon domain-containing protein [Pelotomaculum sp.]